MCKQHNEDWHHGKENERTRKKDRMRGKGKPLTRTWRKEWRRNQEEEHHCPSFSFFECEDTVFASLFSSNVVSCIKGQSGKAPFQLLNFMII